MSTLQETNKAQAPIPSTTLNHFSLHDSVIDLIYFLQACLVFSSRL